MALRMPGPPDYFSFTATRTLAVAFSLSCILQLGPTACAGDLRSWVDKSRSIEFKAEFLRVEGDWVLIRRQDGGEGRVPISWLSEADQRFVAQKSSSVGAKPDGQVPLAASPSSSDRSSETLPDRVALPIRSYADKTVEDFIAYDTGKLGCSEGIRVREEFDRLGNESIGPLVRGLNESAKIGSSCPVMVLRSKLMCCLARNSDPRLDVMAASNLCCGVSRTAPHYRALSDLRTECINRLPLNHPIRLRESRVAALLALNDDAAIDRALRSADVSDRQAAVTVACSMGPRFGRELIAALRDKDSTVRKEAHEGLVALACNVDHGPRNIGDEKACEKAAADWEQWYRQQVRFALPPQAWPATRGQLIKWLGHSDPQTKATAVLVARYRRLFLVTAIIPLLDDPSQMVRREAHNALVDLADGEDLGPKDASDDSQVAAAVERWKLWEDRRKRRFRNATKTDDQIVVECSSADDEIRLAAVSTAVLRQLSVPEKLVPLVSDRVPEVRQAARQGLIHLADGTDFGPSEGDDTARQAEAASRWAAWLRTYKPPARAATGAPAAPARDPRK